MTRRDRVYLVIIILLGLALFAPWEQIAPGPRLLPVESQPITTPRLGADFWTATRTRTDLENAAAHCFKHCPALGIKHVDDYVARARNFLHNPPPGVQTKKQRDGDTVRFNPKTGEFAVMRRDGTPRTYFILDPKIHGFPNNQAYFDAQ